MRSQHFVPTDLYTKASTELQKEIQIDLKKKDPEKEVAKAAIEEAIKRQENDKE